MLAAQPRQPRSAQRKLAPASPTLRRMLLIAQSQEVTKAGQYI